MRIAGSALDYSVDMLMSLPRGLVKRIKDVLIEDELAGKRLLHSAYALLQTSPQLQSLLDRQDFEQLKSIESMERFFSVRDWLSIFENYSEILTNQTPDVTAIPSGENSDIIAFLLNISLQERKIIFSEFVTKNISESVRKQHPDVFAGLQDVSALNSVNIARMTKITGATMGLRNRENFNSQTAQQDITIIEDSLQESLIHSSGSPTNMAYKEYLSTLRLMKMQSLGNAAEDPAVLLQNMPSSALRGGLNFGIVKPDMLASMHNSALQTVHEQQQDMGKIAEELESLTSITERQVRNEAKTYADIWYEMPGWQKAAAIAVLVGVAFHKGTRKLAVGLGAAYFAQKFFLQNEGAKLLTGLADKASVNLRTMNRFILRGVDDTLEIQGIANRTETVVEFLNDYDTQNLQNEGTGFALLANVPLKDLAQSFSTEGSNWHLKTESNSPAMRRLRAILAKQGLSNKSLQFFKEQQANTEVSEALTYVFYKMALEDPANASLARVVEDKWHNQVMHGLNKGELFKGDETTEAGRAYRTLVEKGRFMATRSSETLSNFMVRHIVDVQKDSQADTPERSNLTVDQQKFIESIEQKTQPLTIPEEAQLITLLPLMRRFQRRRMQEVLLKNTTAQLQNITVDTSNIERLAYLCIGLPTSPALNSIRRDVIAFCSQPQNIDSALSVALLRENMASASQKEHIQFVLNRVVVQQSEMLMKELMTVPIANIERHAKYDTWLSTAEKLCICAPETADSITDIASFMLEYLLYQGKYADPDQLGRTGKDKYMAHLEDVQNRYNVGRALSVSDDVAGYWFQRILTNGAESRLQSVNTNWDNTIFTRTDINLNIEERIQQLKIDLQL